MPADVSGWSITKLFEKRREKKKNNDMEEEERMFRTNK